MTLEGKPRPTSAAQPPKLAVERRRCRRLPERVHAPHDVCELRVRGTSWSLMSNLDLTLSIVLGVALAAATGFRVFLPLLIASVAAYTGHLPLGDGFAWLGTPAALTMLGVAAVAEILAFYIPGIDNLLDALATPAAFVAGTVVSAAVMTDVPPMVKWTAAVIAGGGVAGLTQGVTAMLRAKSTLFTGGLGNLVIATAELGGALLVSLLALAAPLLALAVVILFLWLAIRLLRRLLRAAHPPTPEHGR